MIILRQYFSIKSKSKPLTLDEVFILCKILMTCCELFVIHKQLTPVFPLQYSLKCFITMERQGVIIPDKGFVILLLEAATNLLIFMQFR